MLAPSSWPSLRRRARRECTETECHNHVTTSSQPVHNDRDQPSEASSLDFETRRGGITTTYQRMARRGGKPEERRWSVEQQDKRRQPTVERRGSLMRDEEGMQPSLAFSLHDGERLQ